MTPASPASDAGHLPPGFTPYGADRAGDVSGVAATRIGRDHVDVIFRRGGAYRYDVLSARRAHLDEMARLARAGRGLAGFINRVAHDRYARRLW